MKTFTFSLQYTLIILLLISSVSLPQQSDEKKWSVIQTDPLVTKPVLPDFTWTPAEQVPRFYDLASGITVGPNFRPKPTTNSTQSEVSVDVHPSNKDIVFCSANATDYPVTGVYGTGVYWSVNGGISWTGYDNPPFGGNRGDPASVIGTDGRFYENYISATSGQGVSVSTNNGTTWSSYTIAPNPGTLADKNHYMVDKKAGSPYENRSYCSWTDFGGTYNNQVVLRYSSNFGVSWSSSINLSGSLNPLSHAQGTNIQTGPNGEVYVTYAIYDAWPGGEDAIGFSKSTNGGATWTHARIYSATNFGIRGTLSSKSEIRVSSFPSMAVDRSGGSYNGTIYITWPQRGVSPAGSDPDIVMIKSTNGGANWTAPVRVNDDPLNNGKDQYYPWCTVDQSTGQFMIVFYDSRNVANSKAEIYMAKSLNGGASFENFKVSDQAHAPAPITGLASGYAGDYIGVAAHDNTAYAYWGDNRTGIYQGWMAKVMFGTPCPVGIASNPSPADSAINVPRSLPQLSWTNGTGVTQVEVWFGTVGNMSMIYNGGVTTSCSPGPLNYNTSYNWRVISKNDTCSISGPVWSFRTELSPSIVFYEGFGNLSCWNAAGPLGTTNWSTQNTSNAGGTAPELRFSWTPQFNGLSKLVSCPISLLSNRNYSIELRHFFDYYASPAPTIGIGISYDNGATYTPVWSTLPTGNIGPAVVTASFSTPVTDMPEAVNGYLVLFVNGNSFNLDYWYVDNIYLMDDDFSAVQDPTNVTAAAQSTSQINIGFTPNGSSNNVVMVWNLTGTFTAPAGTPPSPGQPFAGGTLLYNGLTSPVQHTGLTPSTTYYYRLFSYNNTSYSSGVGVNAATLALPANPSGVAAVPQSPSQINISFTPNGSSNNVVLVWNLTGTFTAPAGAPPSPGQPFAGGTLLYNGLTSPVQHTGLTPSTTYYYKLFSYDNTNYSAGTSVNASTLALPANPTGVAAAPQSTVQINISFTPNGSSNNVVLVWNLTGTFTAPAGTPPSPGQPFAGGTLLYNGLTSPVQHTGLIPSTAYYYKAFSYNAGSYSSGVQTNAVTMDVPADPTNVSATPISETEIVIAFTPNGFINDIILVWNLTGSFTVPSGTPPAPGQPFAGGTLLYQGTSSPFMHTGLDTGTTYYYKLFSYGNSAYSAGVAANGTTLFPATFQLTVVVSNGWNAVSIPGLHPVNQNVSTWWPGKDPLASVFEYTGGTYFPVTEAVTGKGYWMKNLGSQTYNTGDEWPSGGILLVPHDPVVGLTGWNFIGGYEQKTGAASLTTTPPGLLVPPVYRFNNGYEPVDTLFPGYAYFVKLSGPGQINFPADNAGSEELYAKISTDGYGRILLTDNSGRNYTLYAASAGTSLSKEADVNNFNLPPVPPEGAFDIRYASQRYAERLSIVPMQVEVSGAQFPVKVKSIGIGIILYTKTGEEIIRLKDGEEYIFTATVEGFSVSEYIIPEEYSLEQNYPNPFNPSTTISFALPSDADNVSLSVYNSLGEKIADLVNSALPAGHHKFVWNAGNAASGTYIYRLNSGNFTAVKKMLLIK